MWEGNLVACMLECKSEDKIKYQPRHSKPVTEPLNWMFFIQTPVFGALFKLFVSISA